MNIYSKSDVGRERSCNQDAFVAGEFENGAAFAVVCDGMGGANAGKVASETAATLISDYIVKSYSPKMSVSGIENMLRAAVLSANDEVHTASKEKDEYQGMGTTAVVALATENLIHIVHVGDSRAYLVGKESIERLTQDHSIVQRMVSRGEISEDEAKTHPQKNIITRAIGAESTVLCDYSIVIKPDNSALLICTDGLTNYVDENTIFDIVNNEEESLCAEKLVDKANEQGGGDNITVVLMF